MSIYKKWQDLFSNQTEESFPVFWQGYSEVEQTIYTHILHQHEKTLSGNFKELAEQFNAPQELFMGFLDGVNSSLNTPLPIEELNESSDVELDIDFEKLYYNMLEAKAEHLFTIAEWDNVLTKEKRDEIVKLQRNSKTIIKDKKTGRNDPCPCNSGKKYKKCCGL